MQLQGDLQFLREDISTVEKRRQELRKAKEKYAMKIRMLVDTSSSRVDSLARVEAVSTGVASSQARGGQGGATDLVQRQYHKGRGSSFNSFKREMMRGGGALENLSHLQERSPSSTGLTVAKKRRVLAQVWF